MMPQMFLPISFVRLERLAKRGIIFPACTYTAGKTSLSSRILHAIQQSRYHQTAAYRGAFCRGPSVIAVLRVSPLTEAPRTYTRKTRSIWNITGDKSCTLCRCVFLSLPVSFSKSLGALFSPLADLRPIDLQNCYSVPRCIADAGCAARLFLHHCADLRGPLRLYCL